MTAISEKQCVVALSNISKSYAQAEGIATVLQDVSLTVYKGDYIALVGTSGSGKSTLLNIIGLLDKPTSGSYSLNGKNVHNLNDDEASQFRNRFIGFVFQSFHLLPKTSALENVMLPGMYSSTPLSTLRARARELLAEVGLSDWQNHTPAQLSGGQQQRVSIARALFNTPDLLLADEPTGQLDTATSVEILKIFEKINKQGTTIILVTHDPQTAKSAKRGIRVDNGLLVPEIINQVV